MISPLLLDENKKKSHEIVRFISHFIQLQNSEFVNQFTTVVSNKVSYKVVKTSYQPRSLSSTRYISLHCGHGGHEFDCLLMIN